MGKIGTGPICCASADGLPTPEHAVVPEQAAELLNSFAELETAQEVFVCASDVAVSAASEPLLGCKFIAEGSVNRALAMPLKSCVLSLSWLIKAAEVVSTAAVQ